MWRNRWVQYALTGSIVVFLLFIIFGCAPRALTPAQQVYSLQRQLDLALQEVEAYTLQPPCTEALRVSCHDPEALSTIINAAEVADLALDKASAAVQGDASATSITLYMNQARTALALIADSLVENPS